MMEGVAGTMEQLADLDISSQGVLEQTRKTMAHLAVCAVISWSILDCVQAIQRGFEAELAHLDENIMLESAQSTLYGQEKASMGRSVIIRLTCCRSGSTADRTDGRHRSRANRSFTSGLLVGMALI